MPFSISELFIILVVGLIVIGPKRLPEVALSVGRVVRYIKHKFSGLKEDMDRELKIHELHRNQSRAEEAEKHESSPS